MARFRIDHLSRAAPECAPRDASFESSVPSMEPRHHKAIRVVAESCPGQFGQGAAWKVRPLHWRELKADPNRLPACRQVPSDQEFVISKAAIGGLDDMLYRAQFFFRIGIDARVPALSSSELTPDLTVQPDARVRPEARGGAWR